MNSFKTVTVFYSRLITVSLVIFSITPHKRGCHKTT